MRWTLDQKSISRYQRPPAQLLAGRKSEIAFTTYVSATLMKLLRVQLIPMGYTAAIEESLQIRKRKRANHKLISSFEIPDRDR